MNKIELKEKLESESINPDSYSLDGGLYMDKYVLSQESNGIWSVYYSERGERYNEKIFHSESDACSDLLERLLKNPTTRKNFKPPRKRFL